MKYSFPKIKSFFRWVVEWKWFLYGVAGFILPLGYFYYFNNSDFAIRTVGLTLQLFGVLTVAEDIRSTYMTFNRPNLLLAWIDRLKRFPLFRKKINTMSGYAELSSLTGRATASIKERYSLESDNLEERIDAVKERLDTLNNQFLHMQNMYDTELKQIYDKLKIEKQERQSSDKSIERKIEDALTDTLHMAGTGVVWLMCGIIFTSIPEELGKIILFLR